MFGGHNAPILRRGSKGKLVRIVQEALNRGGYYTSVKMLDIDGYYGPHTKEAVRAFQRHRNLKATGKLTLTHFELLMDGHRLTLNMPQQALTSEAHAGSSMGFSLLRNFPSAWRVSFAGQAVLFLVSVAGIVVLVVSSGYAAKFQWIDKELRLTPPSLLEPKDEPITSP